METRKKNYILFPWNKIFLTFVRGTMRQNLFESILLHCPRGTNSLWILSHKTKTKQRNKTRNKSKIFKSISPATLHIKLRGRPLPQRSIQVGQKALKIFRHIRKFHLPVVSSSNLRTGSSYKLHFFVKGHYWAWVPSVL